jgi:hypothetical protein
VALPVSRAASKQDCGRSHSASGSSLHVLKPERHPALLPLQSLPPAPVQLPEPLIHSTTLPFTTLPTHSDHGCTWASYLTMDVPHSVHSATDAHVQCLHSLSHHLAAALGTMVNQGSSAGVQTDGTVSTSLCPEGAAAAAATCVCSASLSPLPATATAVATASGRSQVGGLRLQCDRVLAAGLVVASKLTVGPDVLTSAQRNPDTFVQEHAQQWAAALAAVAPFSASGDGFLHSLLPYFRYATLPCSTQLMTADRVPDATCILLTSCCIADVPLASDATPPNGARTNCDHSPSPTAVRTVPAGWLVGGEAVGRGCAAPCTVYVPEVSGAPLTAMVLTRLDLQECLWRWGYAALLANADVGSLLLQLPMKGLLSASQHIGMAIVTPGSVLCREGAPVKAVVLLLQGSAVVCAATERGQVAFGEAAALAAAEREVEEAARAVRAASKHTEQGDCETSASQQTAGSEPAAMLLSGQVGGARARISRLHARSTVVREQAAPALPTQVDLQQGAAPDRNPAPLPLPSRASGMQQHEQITCLSGLEDPSHSPGGRAALAQAVAHWHHSIVKEAQAGCAFGAKLIAGSTYDSSALMTGWGVVLVMDVAGIESETQLSVVTRAKALPVKDGARFHGGPQFTTSNAVSFTAAACERESAHSKPPLLSPWSS